MERHHRTIKRMATRKGGKLPDMVFYYNLSPKDGMDEASVPCADIFTYKWRGPGMPTDSHNSNEAICKNFPIGAEVFVKTSYARCTTPWLQGTVTGHGRENQSVEVDGLPRHISHIRLVPPTAIESINAASEENSTAIEHSRPQRVRRPPAWHEDYCYDFEDQEGM